MTADQVRAMLAQRVRAAGGAAEWCRQNGVTTPQYVSGTISGSRRTHAGAKMAPGGQVLQALRLRRVVLFEPIPEGEEE